MRSCSGLPVNTYKGKIGQSVAEILLISDRNPLFSIIFLSGKQGVGSSTNFELFEEQSRENNLPSKRPLYIVTIRVTIIEQICHSREGGNP